MKKGKDIASQFGGLFLVHQNVPGKKTNNLQFNQHLLFIPLQGEIAVDISGEKFAFGLGQMLYLPPNTLHSFSSSENFGERLIAMIEPKLFSPGVDKKHAVKLPLNQFLKELLFYLLLHPQTKSAKSLVSVFSESLAEIMETSALESDLDHLLGRVSDPRLKGALKDLRANLDENRSIDSVAKRAGLSSRNLNRLMVKETGLQPKQWLIHFRIEKAKELLKKPGASVTEVAMSVGYNSLGSFISAFRARTGQLPSEFSKHG